MNNNTYTTRLILLLVLGHLFAKAQTTNAGMLKVQPGTIFSSLDDFDNKAGATFNNNGEVYFYSHLNNDGTIDFDHTGERYVRFEKHPTNTPEAQIISGAGETQFYDLLFNNDADLMPTYQLQQTVSVSGEAEFNTGIVNIDDNRHLLEFRDDAQSNKASDESFVNGRVRKIGDDNFVFDVGDTDGDQGYHRVLSITVQDIGSSAFVAQYFNENPVGMTVEGETPTANKEGNILFLDDADFWMLTKEAGDLDAVISITYNPSTTPAAIYNFEQALRVIRWDDSQKLWVDLGGVVDTQAKTVSTPTTLDAYGLFTIGRVEDTSELIVYNGISNNTDGVNDYFYIKGIQDLANNTVKIFNRWGVKVFETSNYDTRGNVFKGFSNGRATVRKSEKLPTGTYFYIVSYDFEGRRVNKSGYLYLNTN